jgi:hypothetical protein
LCHRICEGEALEALVVASSLVAQDADCSAKPDLKQHRLALRIQRSSSSGPAVWDTFTHLWEKAQLAGTLESVGVKVSGGPVLLAQAEGGDGGGPPEDGDDDYFDGSRTGLEPEPPPKSKPTLEDIAPGLERGTTPGGLKYGEHAFDRYNLKDRQIPPSVIDETVKYGTATPGRWGRTVYYDPANNVTVVLDPNGEIVTFHKGKGKP